MWLPDTSEIKFTASLDCPYPENWPVLSKSITNTVESLGEGIVNEPGTDLYINFMAANVLIRLCTTLESVAQGALEVDCGSTDSETCQRLTYVTDAAALVLNRTAERVRTILHASEVGAPA